LAVAYATDVHYPRVAAEVWKGGFGGEEDGGQVEVDHLLPQLRVHLLDRAPGDQRTGVVDEDVDRGAKPVDRRLHRLARIRWVAKVSLHQYRASAPRFDGCGGLLSFLPAAAVVDRDVGTGAGQGDCGRTPDPGAGAGDDRPLACQVD